MSSLALLTELARDVPRQVTFTQDRCLRRRLNRSECVKCLEVCPAGSLSICGNQVNFSDATCSGCMACTAACPNDAFTVAGFNLEGLLGAEPDREIMITCSRQPQSHPDEYVIPCVGGLTIELLLALGMTRTALAIIDVSGCQSCENKAAADHLETQVTSMKKNHHDIIEANLIILETAKEITPPLAVENRRSFLMGMKNSLVSVVESQLPAFRHHPSDGESRNRRVPKKVKLVKNLLEQLDQKEKDFVSALYLHQLQVSDTCTICPLCKGICPTGAIKIEKVDKEKTLVVDNTLCSGCGLCVTFCKNDALRLQRREGLNTLREL